MVPTPYAVLADITKYSLGTAALGGLSNQQIQVAVDAANSLADSYLGARFRLPLTAWGADLTAQVVAIASWRLMSLRGFDPESPADAVLRTSYEDAIDWFKGVSKGTVVPVVSSSDTTSTPGGPYVQEPSADQNNAGGFVLSKPTSRGW